MIRIVFKNLQSLLRHDRLIAFIILLCVCASTFIIHFAYGLYQNYHVILTDTAGEIQELDITINDPNAVTKEKLMDCIYQLPDEINEAVQMYFLTPAVDIRKRDGSVESDAACVACRFSVYKRQIANSELFESNILSSGTLRGDFFTQEDQHNGALVAVIAETRDHAGISTSGISEYIVRTDCSKQYLCIQDREYLVIGYSPAFIIDIPVESLGSKTVFTRSVDLVFGEKQHDMITKKQYKMIKDAFEKTFGSAVTVPELEIPDQSSIYLYRTIMLIAVVIAMIAALNFSQLYCYIMDKRQRSISIMRICGCGRLRAVLIFLLECMTLMIPTYAVSALFFAKAILPALNHTFEYMQDAFSAIVYISIFCIYFGCSVLTLWCVLYVRIRRNSMIDLQKRR